MTNLKETHAVVTVDDERGLDWLEWSDDGQLLAVASPGGKDWPFSHAQFMLATRETFSLAVDLIGV